MMVLGKVAVKSALWTRHRDIVGSIEASLSDQKQAGGGFFIIDCWSWFYGKRKKEEKKKIQRGEVGILFGTVRIGILPRRSCDLACDAHVLCLLMRSEGGRWRSAESLCIWVT